jgi:FkbM family methyltransferase
MSALIKETIRKILPRSISRHRIIGGPLRGLVIVTSWHDYPAAILGRTETPLVDWFSHHARRGETWLDIGAHFGYTALALARLVGPAGRVFAFEPMISTAGCLAQTRQMNRFANLTVVPIGLGQPESFASLTLPVTRGMADSTLTAATWHERINVARLDWLWPRICGEDSKIDGIKIDVQGMEADTIRGMTGLLEAFGPKLVIEFHRGVNRGAILGRLRDLGYRKPGEPIEPAPEEAEPAYLDDRSYAFSRTNE